MVMNDNRYFVKGSQFDTYTLVDFIGKGGSAEVWKAKDNANKLWAIKIFSPEKQMENYGIDFFKSEFSKTVDLNHPNILKPLAYSTFGGRPYIVLPLCDGSVMNLIRQKLFDLNNAKTTSDFLFNEDELAPILADVANALHYLHEKGIIHQDVKPDNILFSTDENKNTTYLISDFGVSSKIKKTIMQETIQMQEQKNGLSPDYASPEAFQGDVSVKSDLFSLGVTLYEICTGRTPSKSNTISTGQMLLNGGIIPNLPAFFPGRLNTIVKQMLQMQPAHRPTSLQIAEAANTYIQDGFWPSIKTAYRIPIKKILSFTLPILVLAASFFFYNSIYLPSQNQDTLLNFNFDKAVSAISPQHANAKDIYYLAAKGKNFKPCFYNKYAIFSDENGKMGIVSNEGKIMVNALYDNIYEFVNEDIILVESKGKCGFITINNEVVIPIKNNSCINNKSEKLTAIDFKKQFK